MPVLRFKKNDDSSISIRNADGVLMYSLFHKAALIPSHDLEKLTINTTIGTTVTEKWSNMYFEDGYDTTPNLIGDTLELAVDELRSNFFK